MVTIKEGPERGSTYAFYSDPSYMVWKPSDYLKAKRTLAKKKGISITLPKNGFSAALHNRNIENPLIIGFNGNQVKTSSKPNVKYIYVFLQVYYYDTFGYKLFRGSERPYDQTPERFPPDLTAATSLINGFIYVFRDNQYCVREMNY